MTSNIINPAAEAQKKAMLTLPHQLFLVDEIIDLQFNAFGASFTMGLKSPSGMTPPALTMKMPPLFAIRFAQAILEAAKENKNEILEAQKELENALK